MAKHESTGTLSIPQTIKPVRTAVFLLCGTFAATALSLFSGSAHAGSPKAPPPIVIYDSSIYMFSGLAHKGIPVLYNGKKYGPFANMFGSRDAREASKYLRITEKFFREHFGLNSYDGRGSPIEGIVRMGRVGVGDWRLDPLKVRANAAWLPGKKVIAFGMGESDTLNHFTSALDLIAHEYVHAIDDAFVGLERTGETGAIKEHVADILGQMVQVLSGQGSDDFLIGETVVTVPFVEKYSAKYKRPVRALRDLMNPGFSVPSQPRHVNQIPAQFARGCRPSLKNDQCGIHLLNGIPNQAVAYIVKELGWEKTGRIMFNVLMNRLSSRTDFADYARHWREESLSQLTPAEYEIVERSFASVGL